MVAAQPTGTYFLSLFFRGLSTRVNFVGLPIGLRTGEGSQRSVEEGFFQLESVAAATDMPRLSCQSRSRSMAVRRG